MIGSDVRPRGYLYAFDTSSGRLRWKVAMDRGTAGRVLHLGDQALAVALGGEVIAVDLETGRVVWRAAGPEGVRGSFSGDATLHAGKLFVPWGPGWVDSIDARTGRLLWRRHVDAALNTSATLFDDEVVVGTADGRILRFAPRTGKRLGSFDPDPPGGAFFGALVPTRRCLVGLQASGTTDELTELTPPYTLSCLSPVQGKVRWKFSSAAQLSSPRPLIAHGSAVVGSKNEVWAIDLATGAVRQAWALRGTPRGLGASSSHLLVGTRGGQLFALPW